MKTVIGIHGVCGRTGRRVVDLAHADPQITLAAALDAADHPLLGRDVGEIAGVGPLGLPVTSELALHTRLDCLLDFSTPKGTLAILPTCLNRRIPILVATTGHTADQRAETPDCQQPPAGRAVVFKNRDGWDAHLRHPEPQRHCAQRRVRTSKCRQRSPER